MPKLKTIKMKKIILAITLFVSTLSFSQQEIKVDIFDALALKTLEVSYEHYISAENSVGLAGLFNFDNSNSDFRYNQKSMFTPYFRQYFSIENKWNLFGELFVGINSGKKDIKDEAGVIKAEDYTDGALGVAAGTKYVTASNFTFEAYIGVGRNLFTSNSHSVVPRAGFNVGYRF